MQTSFLNRENAGAQINANCMSRVRYDRHAWLLAETAVTFARLLDEGRALLERRCKPGRPQDLTMSITQHDNKQISGNGRRTMVPAHTRRPRATFQLR